MSTVNGVAYVQSLVFGLEKMETLQIGFGLHQLAGVDFDLHTGEFQLVVAFT